MPHGVEDQDGDQQGLRLGFVKNPLRPSDKPRYENQTNGDSRFGQKRIPKAGVQDYRPWSASLQKGGFTMTVQL
jgi:hypothetical protein